MTEAGIKRILVALDPSDQRGDSLLAACTLAARLDAQLEALFVEDINLLRAADLPMAREISRSSRRVQRLTPEEIERQLRSQVERLRRHVAHIARQTHQSVSLTVLRGQVTNELNLALAQQDLLIIGRNTGGIRRSSLLGSTARQVLASATCHVLLLQHGTQLERPVAVFFSGSEASQRALRLALHIARGDHDRLTVLYPPLAAPAVQALQTEVTAQANTFGISATHISLPGNDTDALHTALKACKARTLVVEVQAAGASDAQRETFLQQSDVPIILVR